MSRVRAWAAWHPPMDRSSRPTAYVYPATGCISIRCGRDGRKLTGLPWNRARSRRAGPLHRWLVDDAATAEVPARPSPPAWRDAGRPPAVLMPRRSHDLDPPGVRCGGVWAAATCRLPRPRRAGRGAPGERRAIHRTTTRPLATVTTAVKPNVSSLGSAEAVHFLQGGVRLPLGRCS
jgi:hypothetical protein